MVTKRSKKINSYIIQRLQEPSTIRGLILVATVAGAKLSPDMQSAILEMGLLLSGLFAVATPDKYKEKE
jgi:hypothetical protein